MPPQLRPIEPKIPRWEPAANPSDIVVPGLDNTASASDQIEQIEQLITIKLQNIDANFSKMQHIMANRVLPAMKRYAIGTQPVREAARFWTAFYEQAAEIRIPTYDDYSTGQEQTTEDHTVDASRTESVTSYSKHSARSGPEDESVADSADDSRMLNVDRTSSDVSFAPSQAAVSSTPAAASKSRSSRHTQDESMPSWQASLDSPLRQLNRDIQGLGDGYSITSSAVDESAYDGSEDVTQRQIKADDGRQEPASSGREPQPLLRDVLRKNTTGPSVTSMSGLSSGMTSPLRFKAKTPVAMSKNPYLPPDSTPSDWTGLVDLRDPTTTSPRKDPQSSVKQGTFKPAVKPPTSFGFMRSRRKTPPPGDDSVDDNFGFSPPVMTDYARLPTLGRTPKKEAAERIMQGLVEVEQRRAAPSGGSRHPPAGKGYSVESSMSTIPTPPSMTGYNRSGYAGPMNMNDESSTDASLDSVMRRVGLEMPGYNTALPPAHAPTGAPAPAASSTTSQSSLASSDPPARPPVFSLSALHPPPLPPVESSPEPVRTPVRQYDDYYYEDDGAGGPADDSLDSLDDSFDAEDRDAAALLYAQQQAFAAAAAANEDDSFSSDSSMADDDDDDRDAQSGTAAPLHAYMGGVVEDGFEDSFEDDDDEEEDGARFAGQEEETVFGVPPAQRLRVEQERRISQGGGLRMLGEELLRFETAQGGVDESPTPWNPGGRG
ncbi:uncharacterized protein BXZ73DRAFT_91330 [Epithele typhae]|uniref:uncharacterized protein n=1 Tax=Epithele typhae TaxID=378194 RepID=UPI00200744DB|nr:uncharacterized protein BXZ73DRAFT_91330 [Epithele typhae]KAH9924349.1 hypothetical protein BXZ73DRAFT_91330 [Epithele typhae]